jgi:hypothetical protein
LKTTPLRDTLFKEMVEQGLTMKAYGSRINQPGAIQFWKQFNTLRTKAVSEIKAIKKDLKYDLFNLNSPQTSLSKENQPVLSAGRKKKRAGSNRKKEACK